jgi:hypothetical protein
MRLRLTRATTAAVMLSSRSARRLTALTWSTLAMSLTMAAAAVALT